MKNIIGTVWEEREKGGRYKVEAVQDGKAQLAPESGGEYRIMAERSLRTNYKMVEKQELAVDRHEFSAPPQLSEEARRVITGGRDEMMAAATAPLVESKEGRALAGRVKMPDGAIIAGSHFIIQVCGKSRDETYKVDSPIRWLVKKGQQLLTEKGATIVYGQALTK